MRIVNAKLFTPEGWADNGYMEITADGRIAAVGTEPKAGTPDADTVDARGAMVVPGLIDVHVHGGGGFDVMSGDPGQLAGMSRYHAANGTTSFLATTLTAPQEDILRALKGAARAMGGGVEGEGWGAELLGVHLEGPFLNPVRCGAQNPANIRNPSMDEWTSYTEAAAGLIKLMTIAPELPGAEAVIKAAIAAGVTVSIGHSDADYGQVKTAVEWGCKHVTHLFNGMRPLHHRDPGVAGGALVLDELAVELIADGVHVHPELVGWVLHTKPDGKVVLVTDCISAGGCPDGEYALGGLPVIMEGGRVYLHSPDGSRGSLAGSSLTTIEALRSAAGFADEPPERLLAAATINPARQIGADRRKGSLEPGKDADFLIVDGDWQLARTFVRGKCVYDRNANSGA